VRCCLRSLEICCQRASLRSLPKLANWRDTQSGARSHLSSGDYREREELDCHAERFPKKQSAFSKRRIQMPGLTEDDIRSRAYLLWEKAGQPAGQMDMYWYEAEKELIAERHEQEESTYLPNLAAH
jgi:Protein of unknown function (DUF2934)